LNSPGGSVLESIKIADALRESGLAVMVDRDQLCASSCFLLWASADYKLSYSNSHIVIHRPYLPTDSISSKDFGEATATTGKILSATRQYLTEQNVPSLLIDKMMQLPSNEGYELTIDDLAQLGYMTPVLEEKAVKYCNISNNTYASSNLDESVACVGKILNGLRLPYLIKLIGFQPAIDAMQKWMVEKSALENGNATENSSPAHQAASMYLWCSLAAASQLNQPSMDDEQIVNSSLAACKKSQQLLSAALVVDSHENDQFSPSERLGKLENLIRSQIIERRHAQ
jgi:hypothetical protein